MCKDWQAGKLTAEEALRNLGEMFDPERDNEEQALHYFEAIVNITEEDFEKSKN